jgi:hypothetical protein
MSDWQVEDTKELWPVKYPSRAVRTSSRHSRGTPAPRWVGGSQADTSELRRRLLRLLLAVEMGAAIAMACVLPLAFVDLPVPGNKLPGAILERLANALSLSSQLTCMILALPVSILLLMLAVSLGLYGQIQKGEDV